MVEIGKDVPRNGRILTDHSGSAYSNKELSKAHRNDSAPLWMSDTGDYSASNGRMPSSYCDAVQGKTLFHGKILLQELTKKLNFFKQILFYKYVPNPVHKNEGYKVYWDRSVLTD